MFHILACSKEKHCIFNSTKSHVLYFKRQLPPQLISLIFYKYSVIADASEVLISKRIFQELLFSEANVAIVNYLYKNLLWHMCKIKVLISVYLGLQDIPKHYVSMQAALICNQTIERRVTLPLYTTDICAIILL